MSDTKQDFVLTLAALLVIAAIVITTITLNFCSNTAYTAIIRYEEFQEIKSACDKLNDDLCVITALPTDSPRFKQFSKDEQVANIKINMNRWIQEYNAKSKMITRNVWKSSELPYQLKTENFTCYK